MKFSIITITYNRAHIIADTIDSVLKQSYQNFELLIIDDASTDHTENVIDTYVNLFPSKIKYIRSEKIGKPSALRNIGLKHATGDYISVLDSDDLWLENKLEEMYKIFKTNDDVHFILHNLRRFYDINNLHDPFYNFKTSFFKNILKELLLSEILAFPVYTMKRCLVDHIGLFDEDIEEGQHDYFLRVAAKYKIFYLNKTLTLMRRHEQNYSKNFDVIHCLDALKTFDKLYNNKLINETLYTMSKSKMDYTIAKFHFVKKHYKDSLYFFNNVIKTTSMLNSTYIKSKMFTFMIKLKTLG